MIVASASQGLAMLKTKPTIDIVLRLLSAGVVISLLGFYPAYLRILHIMCNIVQGHAVRFL
jgi:hypothetical protein